MQGVFSFMEGLPYRPQRPERLFFAVFPGSDTTRQIVELRADFAKTHHVYGSELRADRLHISLHHVGDYKWLRSCYVYAAQMMGNAVRCADIMVTLDRIMTFPSPPSKPQRALVLLSPTRGLYELHCCLAAPTGLASRRRVSAFVPHLTLQYGHSSVPLQPIGPIRFTVRELLLIHSRRGLTRYDILARWPLGA